MHEHEVTEILSHFHQALNLISYICGVQLTVGTSAAHCRASFPEPGCKGGGEGRTMSIDMANVPNPLRVRGEVGSTDFYLTTGIGLQGT